MYKSDATPDTTPDTARYILPETLNAIKLSLRLVDDTFDSELTGHILACKADLEISGINDPDEQSPLVLQAITLYCKGHFGFADINEKSLSLYERLKVSLRVTQGIF